MNPPFGRFPGWTLLVPLSGLRAMRVFLVICLHADKTGRCYPSLDTIAEESGIDRRKIAALVNEVQRAGLIEKETVARGRGRSTVYRVCDTPPVVASEMAPSRVQKGPLPGGPNRPITEEARKDSTTALPVRRADRPPATIVSSSYRRSKLRLGADFAGDDFNENADRRAQNQAPLEALSAASKPRQSQQKPLPIIGPSPRPPRDGFVLDFFRDGRLTESRSFATLKAAQVEVREMLEWGFPTDAAAFRIELSDPAGVVMDGNYQRRFFLPQAAE